MNAAADLPLWLALAVSVLVVAGGVFALIGSFGLLRLSSFYDRVHAPTIGASFGTAFITFASMLLFSVLGTRLAIAEVLIFIFVFITMPVTFMLLARAALFRDRSEGNDDVPPLAEALEQGGDHHDPERAG